jgi:hypothetical protein
LLAAEAQTAFISYSREDSELALKLAEDLKAAGAAVWLDQLDIALGDRWEDAVEEALTDCPRLLVILSPSSVSSKGVRDEVAFALGEGKTVIPALYRDCKIPYRLRPFQYVDVRSDYDRGVKALARALTSAGSSPANRILSALRGNWEMQSSGVNVHLSTVAFPTARSGWGGERRPYPAY